VLQQRHLECCARPDTQETAGKWVEEWIEQRMVQTQHQFSDMNTSTTGAGAASSSGGSSSSSSATESTESAPDEEWVLSVGATDISLLRWVCEQLERDVTDGMSKGPLLRPVTPLKNASRGKFSLFEFYDAESGGLRPGLQLLACPLEEAFGGLPNGLTLAAVLPRGEQRDALVVTEGTHGSLADMPEGSSVCVASPRHRLQVEALFPDLDVYVRGSGFQKHLRRLHSGDYDACLAPAAGLHRIGFGDMPLLDFGEMPPSLGQGLVGLICYSKDEATKNFASLFDDADARCCFQSENALVDQLGRGAAVAGGMAKLLPDGQLELQCTVVQMQGSEPQVSSAKRLGGRNDGRTLAVEITRDLCGTSLQMLSISWPSIDDTVDVEAPDDELDEQCAQVPLSAFDDSQGERMWVEALDLEGQTPYRGKVCAVFSDGALVDVGCEVPARLLPEKGSQMPKMAIGSELEVYCCSEQRGLVRALLFQPPQLSAAHGRFERRRLEEVRNGEGPFRAVVMSCTSERTLVDFNCEVAGQLLESNAYQAPGAALRVYCVEVDTLHGCCTVSINRPGVVSREPKRLEELEANTPYRGTVKRITKNGAHIDFNCEVTGFVGATDINMDKLPEDGLVAGREVTVYVSQADLGARRVRLSMFPARKITYVN